MRVDMNFKYDNYASFLLLPDRYNVMDMIKSFIYWVKIILDQNTYIVRVWSFENFFEPKMKYFILSKLQPLSNFKEK